MAGGYSLLYNAGMRKCTVTDCERDHEAHGFCTAHYGRWRRYGDPTGGPYALRSADEATRFWHWANPKSDDECWEVPKGSSNGYGHWKRPDGKLEGAHRASWRLAIGREPQGLIRHLCNNKRCVNPSHLAEGNASDNALDSIKAGTFAYRRGESGTNVKYTYAQIEAVLAGRAAGMSYRQVAAATGVNRWTVRNVVRRGQWPEVEGERV